MNTAGRFFLLNASSDSCLPREREDDDGTNDCDRQLPKRPTWDGRQAN